MHYADFVHLVRASEHASEEDGAAYRRRLAAFAGLGYAWAVGTVLLALATLWWSVQALARGPNAPAWAAAVAAAAVLLWNGARALWCRCDVPEGVRVWPAEAPELFEALEHIRGKVQGPPIHQVLLDDGLLARIAQGPGWWPFGRVRNTLVIGLPLMMALDRQRLFAVLAHEYGHLRQDHGRFAAWVYRTRASFSGVYACLQQHGGLGVLLGAGFPGWYFPRFVARSFALARQDEFEADRISARLLGGEVAAGALTELALKADWLQQHFWPAHWAQAADQPRPVGPYRRMRMLLALPLPDEFARRSLRHALRRTSGVEDTHPVLRERLDGLGLDPHLPTWSTRPVLGLLGPRAAAWIAEFDARWCRENGTAWKQHHAALARIRLRIAELQARPARSADEWTQLGELQRRLQPHQPARACYAQALACSPRHGAALQGLYACLPVEQGRQRLACLERLHEASPQHRWWAAQTAVATLENDDVQDGQALGLWRERLREAQGEEARAWAELTRQPFLEHAEPPDLSAFERYELEAELANWVDVQCAWLLRRPVSVFPARRCYVLVLEMPRLQAQQAQDLCRALEPCLRLPGPVLLLWSGQCGELARLRGRLRPLYDKRV